MANDDSPNPTISLDDLYGKSSEGETVSESEENVPTETQPAEDVKTDEVATVNDAGVEGERLDPKHIVYEETPVITPIEEQSVTAKTEQRTSESTSNQTEKPSEPPVVFTPIETEQKNPEPQQKPVTQHQPPRPRRGNPLKTILTFIVIFAVGMGASVLYRNLVLRLTGENDGEQATSQEAPLVEEDGGLTGQTDFDTTQENQGETEVQEEITQVEPTGWRQITIQRGSSRADVPGITYSLPEGTFNPVCDGSSCPSQGTYLDGGTRFTVAVYDKKLTGDDLSRTKITDAAGRTFETIEASISGRPALEFSGTFTGTTTGGYRFTAMRGYMILTPNGKTLEINHFSPAGITADFELDEAVFEKIVGTVEFE